MSLFCDYMFIILYCL